MTKVWQRILTAFLLVLGVGVVVGLALFHYATHLVAGRLAPPPLVRISAPAPDLVFRTLNGQPWHLSATRGKVVFLDLWGTWCIQCVAEMPTVQALYDHYKNDPHVEFLIVSRMDSPDAVRAYARRNHLTLPFYITQDEDVPESMRLHQYPSTFLYGRDGSMVAEHAGGADWSNASVIRFIDSLKGD